MNTKFTMTTRELYRSIGLSQLDISKVDDPEFVWAIAPFDTDATSPTAAFTNFDCALGLVKRLNAFIEGGVELRPIAKATNFLETDRYRHLAEIGLTPYLISVDYEGTGIELIENLGNDLDELTVEKYMLDVGHVYSVRNKILGTFWAPNGHLAIKKAKVFKALTDTLKAKRQVSHA